MIAAPTATFPTRFSQPHLRLNSNARAVERRQYPRLQAVRHARTTHVDPLAICDLEQAVLVTEVSYHGARLLTAEPPGHDVLRQLEIRGHDGWSDPVALRICWARRFDGDLDDVFAHATEPDANGLDGQALPPLTLEAARSGPPLWEVGAQLLWPTSALLNLGLGFRELLPQGQVLNRVKVGPEQDAQFEPACLVPADSTDWPTTPSTFVADLAPEAQLDGAPVGRAGSAHKAEFEAEAVPGRPDVGGAIVLEGDLAASSLRCLTAAVGGRLTLTENLEDVDSVLVGGGEVAGRLVGGRHTVAGRLDVGDLGASTGTRTRINGVSRETAEDRFRSHLGSGVGFDTSDDATEPFPAGEFHLKVCGTLHRGVELHLGPDVFCFIAPMRGGFEIEAVPGEPPRCRNTEDQPWRPLDECLGVEKMHAA